MKRYSVFILDQVYFQFLDVDESRPIRVKEFEGLPDLLLLLLCELWFGGGLLARRGHWTLQGWSLGAGGLEETMSQVKYKFSMPHTQKRNIYSDTDRKKGVRGEMRVFGREVGV